MAQQLDINSGVLDKRRAWANGHGDPEALAAGSSVDADPVPPPPHPAAHIGNPAPLGLLAFGMTTCFLMFMTAGWAESTTMAAMMTYAIAYGGAAQVIAGIFELIKGNTFAGTAFTSYGCFWVAFFVTKYLSATSAALSGGVGHGPFAGNYKVGETLIMAWWSLFTFCLFVPTLRKNGCLMTVFGSLTITFALLAGGQWSPRCAQAAGYVGVFCGCSAIYAAFAEIWHESIGLAMPGLRPVRFI